MCIIYYLHTLSIHVSKNIISRWKIRWILLLHNFNFLSVKINFKMYEKNQNTIGNKIKKNWSVQISNDTFVKFLVILSFDLFHGLQTAIQLLSQATYPRERSRNICQDKRSVFSSPNDAMSWILEEMTRRPQEIASEHNFEKSVRNEMKLGRVPTASSASVSFVKRFRTSRENRALKEEYRITRVFWKPPRKTGMQISRNGGEFDETGVEIWRAKFRMKIFAMIFRFEKTMLNSNFIPSYDLSIEDLRVDNWDWNLNI